MTHPLTPQDGAPQGAGPQSPQPQGVGPASGPSADAWLGAQLEQYKMYVETAEQNSERRTVANRLYITLHTALLTLLAVVGGYGLVISLGGGTGTSPKSDFLTTAQTPLVVVASLLGVVLCFVWDAHIKSFRDLNTAKFHVINDVMEPQLPFQPFQTEWEELKKLKRNYLQFNALERIIIWLTAFLYIAWLVIYLVVTFHPQWPRFPSL